MIHHARLNIIHNSCKCRYNNNNNNKNNNNNNNLNNSCDNNFIFPQKGADQTGGIEVCLA